jgi:sensitive to high expression protein 9
LVRTDHASNLAVTQSKLALVEAELAVEQAFDALMKSILERYHEEQVWSDKIRSVSTYGSLAVLVVNLIVFLGAIAIVEPWKRKRLVLGLEERVAGMMKQVEEKIEKEVSVVGSAMVALQSRLDEELPTFKVPPSEQPADVVQVHGQTTHATPNTSISSALTQLTTRIYASIPYLDEIGPSDQADRDFAMAGLAGVLGGGLVTGLAMLAMTRSR